MNRFEGLTVLITGATGGFGRCTAERLADQGARLVLSDLDAEAVEAFAAGLDCETATLAGDIADEATSEALVKLAVKRFGALDIAINNAGVAQSFVKLAQVPSDEARRILEVDLLGVFFAMKHQIPAMVKQNRARGHGGAIVNLSSVAGLTGATRLSVYSAAKHGVLGLTRSAAAEYAAKGVRINAVCPSYARTAMVGDLVKLAGGHQTEALAGLTRGVPMRRVAEIDEVIEVVLFAADPKNSFMTGHALAVDGGVTSI
ncbi:SDR family oxidoreductase [Mesorhizobium sp. NBSH29]|uniref:SDR family NAD(P)-dependent oxidoreductase n=1 Tax=Mesorhizobium sp. NBSH29 TaxID=2654249 RepID=UPI001896709F|nr:SDR family oxidoreductase [Mesorhizobium sp. NBSH29]QPC85505.1 SDR family oxidoreductase [Mesorhizobium sp. NBSH29]